MLAAKITAAMESALLALINGYRPRLHVSTRDALTRRGLFDGVTLTETGREIAGELRAAARAEFEADMAQYIAEGAVQAAWVEYQHSPSWTHVQSSGWSNRHSTIVERATCRGCSAGIARAVPDGGVPATCRVPWVTAAALDDAPTVTCPNRWDSSAASSASAKVNTLGGDQSGSTFRAAGWIDPLPAPDGYVEHYPPAPASSAGDRAVVPAQRHATVAEIDTVLAVGERAAEPEPERHSGALIGDLWIVLPDGTALHASTDLALAEHWASVTVTSEHGPGSWEALTAGQRYGHIAGALSELRRSHAAAQ